MLFRLSSLASLKVTLHPARNQLPWKTHDKTKNIQFITEEGIEKRYREGLDGRVWGHWSVREGAFTVRSVCMSVCPLSSKTLKTLTSASRCRVPPFQKKICGFGPARIPAGTTSRSFRKSECSFNTCRALICHISFLVSQLPSPQADP